MRRCSCAAKLGTLRHAETVLFIDHDRTEQNINLQFTAEGRVLRCGSFDAKEFELSRYEQLYGPSQEAKNARYIQDGHPERCKTVADIYASRRTAPLETIIQLGSRDTGIDPYTV